MNARIKKKQLKAKLELENQILDQEIANLNISLKRKQAKIKQKQAQIRALESLIDPTTVVARVKADKWKKTVNVSSEVGKKKYTEGQKNYIRALKVIENALNKPAADIAAVYGSDDIEELANQYYVKGLGDYSKEELNQIEKEFNETHGYHIRLEKATNPFAGIDFNTLMPN